MADTRNPDLVLTFPELSHAQSAVIAQELMQELIKAGINRNDLAVARSYSEATDLGGTLALFGDAFLEGAGHKLGEYAIDWLIEKYKVFIVAKSGAGESWAYGPQYQKGIETLVGNKVDEHTSSHSQWFIQAKAFSWNGVKLILRNDHSQRILEYRNDFKYEVICIDGNEVCRGGGKYSRQRVFSFEFSDKSVCYPCSAEPTYTWSGRNITARLSGIIITIGRGPTFKIQR